MSEPEYDQTDADMFYLRQETRQAVVLLRRYLDNHCANSDAEGMSTLCECQLCRDTRRFLRRP